MKKSWVVLILLLVACQQQGQKKEIAAENRNALKGEWQFLDKYGNYNEAYFGDSTYQTINRFVDRKVVVDYRVKGDTLRSVMDYRNEKRVILAGLRWIDSDHVVIFTEFVSDTLTRMEDAGISLKSTDPFTDSLSFFTAFNKRYDRYLVDKGIVSEDEIRAFRERQEVPVDVLKKKTDR